MINETETQNNPASSDTSNIKDVTEVPTPVTESPLYASLYERITEQELATLKIGSPWLLATEDDKLPDGVGPLLRVGCFLLDYDLWIATAQPHHLTPPAAKSDYSALLAFVEQTWVQEAVTINAEGKVIDGYHRLRTAGTAWGKKIAQGASRVSPSIPNQFVRFHSYEHERLYVLTKGCGRQYSPSMRRERASRILRDGFNGTDKYIAQLCGIAKQDTVTGIREQLEESGQLSKMESRHDRRGRWHTVKSSTLQPKPHLSTSHKTVSSAVTTEEGPAGVTNNHDNLKEQNSDEAPILYDPYSKDLDPSQSFTQKAQSQDRRIAQMGHPGVKLLKALIPHWWHQEGFQPTHVMFLMELGQRKCPDEYDQLLDAVGRNLRKAAYQLMHATRATYHREYPDWWITVATDDFAHKLPILTVYPRRWTFRGPVEANISVSAT